MDLFVDQTETTPERPLTRRELRARAAAAVTDADEQGPDEHGPEERGPDEQVLDEQGLDERGLDGQRLEDQVFGEQREEEPQLEAEPLPEAEPQPGGASAGGEEFDPRTGGPGAADVTMELPRSALGLEDEGDETDGTPTDGEDHVPAPEVADETDGSPLDHGHTDDGPTDDAPTHDGPTHDEPVDAAPADATPADDPEASVATPPRPWDLAVGWSLRQELPAELPPEPDVDDVHWEPAPAEPLGAQEAEELGASAIAGQPVDVTPEGSGASTEAEPSDEDGTTDEGDDASVAGREASPAASGPSRFSGWPGPAMGVGHEGGPGYRTFPPVGSTGPVTGPVPARRPGATQPPETSSAPAASTSSLPRVPRTGAPPVPAGGSPATTTPAAPLPTLTDLLAARPVAPAGPAELGWQATVRRLTGGLIAPAPGRAEQAHRAAVAAVQRSLEGPKTVVVLNPKGGAHKTTATLLIAATFGLHRGGYTLAWDNNETRGTLGWRSQQSRHHNTALNLLQDLDRFADPSSARVGDLDNYVRSQGSAQFDVLASDEDAASAASIDAFAFRSLHRTLSRFYRVMVIDTGNNMRASNWQAAVEAADQVVIVSTVREDTAQSAAWAVDALRATGHEDVVRRAVTVLSAPAPQRDDRLAERLHEHFGRLTRTVLDVPYDPSLVAGRPLDYDALSRQTREAWLQVTAAVADGL